MVCVCVFKLNLKTSDARQAPESVYQVKGGGEFCTPDW